MSGEADVLGKRTGGVLRATRGEFTFDDDVGNGARDAIREMWVNRLSGFHARDLNRYLRDNVEGTRYVWRGRCYSFKTFRRVFRLLFGLQRLGSLVGFVLSAEMLDARVSREGELFTARGTLVLFLGGRVVRQSRLVMSCRRDGDRWVWDHVSVERLRRADWRYRCSRSRSLDREYDWVATGQR